VQLQLSSTTTPYVKRLLNLVVKVFQLVEAIWHRGASRIFFQLVAERSQGVGDEEFFMWTFNFSRIVQERFP
jgi:hypothetical protein